MMLHSPLSIGRTAFCCCCRCCRTAGSANSLAFQDLSGRDLRKQRFTKADLRGTKFECVCMPSCTSGSNCRAAQAEEVQAS